MTGLTRLLAATLGGLLIVCAWLPWVGSQTALAVSATSIWDPGHTVAARIGTSMALLLWLSGGIVLLGAALDRRGLVVAGSLVGTAAGLAWLLSNGLSTSAEAIPLASVHLGAYIAIATALVLLLVAALARDTATPTVR